MTIRIQIYDLANNFVTVQLTSPTAKGDGTWMPESPGMVKSAAERQNNVYSIGVDPRDPTINSALLETRTGTGGLASVLFLRQVSKIADGRSFVLKQGDGDLELGGSLTMRAGTIGWTKL